MSLAAANIDKWSKQSEGEEGTGRLHIVMESEGEEGTGRHIVMARHCRKVEWRA